MEVKHRLGPDLLSAILAITMPGVVLALWLPTVPAIPVEVPALTLPADQVRAAIDAERARAADAPDDALEARRRALYLEQGLAEVQPGDEARAIERHRELAAVLAEIAAAHGEDGVAAIRARDVERMVPALAGQGDATERAGELGGFASSLERWGATVEGRRVASEHVIRALFAARWNVAHGRPPTDGFGTLRLRAYHGWLALHGDAAPPALRAAALDAYEQAGGEGADEARAVLAWRAGEPDLAAAAFTRAHQRTGNLRMRNHAAAASSAD